MDRIIDPPIGFAHRGARAHAPENTLEAFALALKLGATGLESDTWTTADGVVLLDHDGVVRAGRRKRAITDVGRVDAGNLPSLDDLFDACGTDYELSVDVKDGAAEPVIRAAVAHGFDLSRLWLCHPDTETVASWRTLSPAVRLLDSTRLHKLKEGAERRAARLQDLDVDGINLHHTDWTLGLVVLFHRFDRACFGWDAQHPRTLAQLLATGIDAVYSDDPDLMTDAITHATR